MFSDTMTFNDTDNVELRTDADYDMPFDEFDWDNRNRPSNILRDELGLGNIKHFVMDAMHDVDLGAIKKYLRVMRKQMSTATRLLLDKRLIAINKYAPSEFKRGARRASEAAIWKASEFQNWLLYWGLAALKGTIADDEHYLFTLLSVSIRVLSRDRHYGYWEATKDSLSLFVTEFAHMYGAHNVVCCVHKLTHFTDEVRRLGKSLYSFSAYPFESLMGAIMKMTLFSKVDVIAQLSNRIIERAELHALLIPRPEQDDKIFMKPGGAANEVRKAVIGGITFSDDFKDSFFSLAETDDINEDKRCVKIDKILGTSKDDLKISCFFLKDTKEFFTEPIPSSMLGIYEWERGKYAPGFKVFEVKELKTKLACIPINESEKDFVLLPMSHELLCKENFE